MHDGRHTLNLYYYMIIIVPLLPCDCNAFMENLAVPCLTAQVALIKKSCTCGDRDLIRADE